jgi:hypothetical protein
MVAYFLSAVKKLSLVKKKPVQLGILAFVICAAVATFFIVKSVKKKRRAVLADQSVYSEQNYTDLEIDSLEIESFFDFFPATDSIKNEVKEFYLRRSYQLAWFNEKGITEAAPNFYSQVQNYRQVFADNSLDNNTLDRLMRIAQTAEKQFLSQEKKVSELELLLTTTFFNYAEKTYSGTVQDPFDLEWFIPRKKKNYQTLLNSLVSLTPDEDVQEPVNHYYILL